MPPLEYSRIMVKITFIQQDGTEQMIDAPVTGSLMEAAKNNSVPGILADCGGACACATCHIVVDPRWVDMLPPPGAEEKAMLEFALGVEPTSRLSCQIKLDQKLDGLVLRLPGDQ
jgi:2Fe-2S ferredoxin